MPTSSSVNRATAVTAVCLAAAVLLVFGGFKSYQVSSQFAERYPDTFGLARSHERFLPVIERVPPSGQLGYITELEPSAENYSALFLSAQYALAPRQLTILKGTQRPEIALGNFTRPVDYAAAGAANGYTSATDFGNGVVLFRRK